MRLRAADIVLLLLGRLLGAQLLRDGLRYAISKLVNCALIGEEEVEQAVVQVGFLFGLLFRCDQGLVSCHGLLLLMSLLLPLLFELEQVRVGTDE